MNKLRLLVSALLATGMVAGLAGTVNAAAASDTNDTKCEVYARSYSIGKDTVTANFEVKNTVDNTACTKDVTVASWNAPNGVDGAPFNQQTFVDSQSGTFPVGFHALTVKKPVCFYQVDLLRGLSAFGPTGKNDYQAGQYVSSAHGGEECKPTPVPQPVAVVTATGGPAPKALPNTGPGEVLPIAVAAGAGATFLYEARLRRQKR